MVYREKMHFKRNASFLCLPTKRTKKGGNPVVKKKIRYTALYELLFRDDALQGESNSITNQKKYLEDYAQSIGIKNYRHFSDDGYSRTNFVEVR